MKCNNCDVEVEDSLINCPLCKTKIKNKDSYENNFYPSYNKFNILRLRYNLFILSAFLTCILSIILNIFIFNNILWSLLIIGTSFYIWFFINHTLQSNSNLGERIFCNFLVASAILFIFDKMVSNSSLSLDYIIPILVIGILFSINMIVFIHKFKWKDYFIYHIMFFLICISSFIYYLFSQTNITWAWLIAVYFSVLSVLFMSIRFYKKLKIEIQKRLHI